MKNTRITSSNTKRPWTTSEFSKEKKKTRWAFWDKIHSMTLIWEKPYNVFSRLISIVKIRVLTRFLRENVIVFMLKFNFKQTYLNLDLRQLVKKTSKSELFQNIKSSQTIIWSKLIKLSLPKQTRRAPTMANQ